MSDSKLLIEFGADWKLRDLLFSRAVKQGEVGIAAVATFVSGDQTRQLRFSGFSMAEACELMNAWAVAVYFDPAVQWSEVRYRIEYQVSEPHSFHVTTVEEM
jgi:hypothetical protein